MFIAHVNLARGFRGGERQTALLIEELAASGVEQTLVCRGDSPLRELLKTVPNLSFHRAGFFFSGHFGFNQKPDLIHAHDAKGARWAWIEKGLRKTPYIITRRVPNAINPAWSTRSVYQNARCVVAISRAIERVLKAYEPDLQTVVIPSAATTMQPDAAKVAAIRAEYAGRKIVGHVGALSDHHKGQSYLIEAARSLQKSHPELVFLLLGEGKDEAKLKALAADLENVRFLGFKPNVADYIAAFDLFVFPSLEEGLGSTLIDVMRLGVPIIATAVDGIVELIEHEKTGILVPPKDSAMIMAAIERLLKDTPLAQALTNNASTRAENLSAAGMAKSYLAFYKRMGL